MTSRCALFSFWKPRMTLPDNVVYMAYHILSLDINIVRVHFKISHIYDLCAYDRCVDDGDKMLLLLRAAVWGVEP